MSRLLFGLLFFSSSVSYADMYWVAVDQNGNKSEVAFSTLNRCESFILNSNLDENSPSVWVTCILDSL